MNGVTASEARQVRGVRLIEMRQVLETARGSLAVGEWGRELPFLPCRIFVTYGVPDGKARGNHAHRRCDQLLICTHGACRLWVDDGGQGEELLLNRPALAAYVPRMVWSVARWRSPDSVLVVLASRPYEPDDYIRDYAEFQGLVKTGARGSPW